MNKRWKDNLRFGILVAVGAVVILWIGDGLEKYVIAEEISGRFRICQCRQSSCRYVSAISIRGKCKS